MNDDNSEKSNARNQYIRLFLQNQKKIYYYILMLVPNLADADDVMQETAEVMWARFDQFTIGTNFAAWGVKIAHHKVLQFKRDRASKGIRFIEDLAELAVQNTMEDEHREHLEILQDCVDKLSDKDRRLIHLRYEQDLTIKRIAQVVSRPLEGMYKAMTRIHNKLVGCMDRGISVREHA